MHDPAGAGDRRAEFDQGVPPVPERRDWLRYAVFGGMVGTLGALLYPVVQFLRPQRKGTGGPGQMVAPYRVSDLKEGPDGKWPAPFNFGGTPCLLIKMKDQKDENGETRKGEIKAFNAICTHVDCTVEFRSGKGDIFCNCHNGVYNLNGRNVSGPPPRPLETYTVTLDPGGEEIRVSR